MPLLVAVLDGRPHSVHPVNGPCVAGAGEGCGIVLAHPTVGSTRLRITPAGGTFRLEYESPGQRPRALVLSLGDAFALGQFQLALLDVPTGELPDADRKLGERLLKESRAGSDLAQYRELEALFFLSSHFEHLSSVDRLLAAMLERLELLFRAERGAILLDRGGSKGLQVAVLHSRDAGGRDFQFSHTVADEVFRTGRAQLVSDTADAKSLSGARSIREQMVRSVICAPLADGRTSLGVVYLDSRLANRVFDSADRDLLARFSANAVRAIGPARERDQLQKDVQVLKRLNRELKREEHDTEEMVVGSAAMRWVMEQVDLLAGSETTTLILGESGTGKELIAKAIHDRSPRRDQHLVPVNVMAMAPTVVESELFGHEKGAFTGAADRRIGRFEMAQRGTLFLDECGELSLEMQIKLLRVLEARVIERVGGTGPIPVDVRLVCATNADIPALIAQGKFREDLYYRLNVFSLEIPPLRRRLEEVPLLVDFFIRKFRAKSGRPIEGISGEALGYLQEYGWPGNIRELRNVIERAFVLERERLITPKSLPFNLVKAATAAPARRGADTGTPRSEVWTQEQRLAARLSAQEEVLVRAALEKHRGNISQAARELGITRKTLYKRMREYGLSTAEPDEA